MANTTAATPEFRTSKETSITFKNLELKGVETLEVDKITTIFEVTRQINTEPKKSCKIVAKTPQSQTVEHMTFNLAEVSSEELAVYRKMKIPSFVLKVDGKLYYARIPNNISFVSFTILGAHRCAFKGHECHRLSAASDEQGGCAKVRDRSRRIERYPWITTGYETFNTRQDSFIVVDCLHYKKCPPQKKPSDDKVNKAKLFLAQFWREGVDSIEEALEIMNKQ